MFPLIIPDQSLRFGLVVKDLFLMEIDYSVPFRIQVILYLLAFVKSCVLLRDYREALQEFIRER